MRRLRVLLFAIASLLVYLPALSVSAHAQVISVFGPLAGNPNVWTGSNQFTNGVTLGPVTVSQLSGLTGLSTTVIVSNATPGSNPCTSGGTGALAVYVNNQWSCGGSGGVGTVTSITATTPLSGGTITASGSIGLTACATNQTWVWNGSAWACTTVSSSLGTVTSVGLAGTANEIAVTGSSPITTSGAFTLSLPSTLTLSTTTNVPTGATLTIQSGGTLTCASGSTCPSGSGNPTLDNCTPDETGNSFYSVNALTAYFQAGWQFIFNTTTYINCTVYIPSAATGATVVVDVWSADSTSGHTATITYADGVINSGTVNIGSLTSAAGQTFTTTSTANNRVTLTFNVQSTLSSGSILAVKIGTSPTGTPPTANLNVYAHLIL